MKINLSINKVLLPMKAHYFLFNAGTGCIVPFMSVLARQLGFSSVTVGIIYTISPFASMVSKPTMGAFSDRFHCKKIVFLAGILLTALAVFLLNFAPSVPTSHKMRFSCNDMSSTMDTCVDNFTITDDCAVESITTETGNITVNCQMTCQMDSSAWRTVCNAWNMAQYCNTNSSTLSFTATTPANSARMINECLRFNIGSINLDGNTFTPLCPAGGQIESSCDIECDAPALNELVANPLIADDEVYGHSAFWVVMLLYVLIWIFQAVAVTNSDAICFHLLEKAPHKYGYQRLWGAVGWGIFTFCCGYIIDFHSQGKSQKDYTPAIYLGMGMLILNFIVAFFIKYDEPTHKPNIFRDVGRLLTNVRFLVYIVWSIFVGICVAMVWNFLYWVVEDIAAEAGCDSTTWIKTLEGLMQVMQCLAGELPFFFLSGWILKYVGHVNCMTLVTFVLGIRFMLYSIIKNPWLFLPVEMLNGITFGLFYSTLASYASLVAPPGAETTCQGIAGAVFEGVGVSLGSLMGGYLIEIYGGSMTFRILSIAAFVFSVLHALVQFILQKCSPNNAPNSDKNLSE
ncbi:major facilitator superfamily domain-containing protein 6-A-like [Agrilus planipennis]|uniref:Major facilitator superfamily domain-containing protein 6-A-like n=1 Tax=Agrilus planipennis TaxID=224129 RepID=A0A1W4WMG1_AGRPL|nr:major facilitator superfamily domain-containing protein 6-A-like [Agrilus planipennis]XP_018325100.1 major facilitator superfamily domain-containing protein 6-A-like [Agrilus planipennis]XP_018325101.1 major facilitator superfamily domain-containing protein 6-A-like [Agrilus planipennis]